MPKEVQIRDLGAGPGVEAIGDRLADDEDHATPHIVDIEVFGVIRREHLRGLGVD